MTPWPRRPQPTTNKATIILFMVAANKCCCPMETLTSPVHLLKPHLPLPLRTWTISTRRWLTNLNFIISITFRPAGSSSRMRPPWQPQPWPPQTPSCTAASHPPPPLYCPVSMRPTSSTLRLQRPPLPPPPRPEVSQCLMPRPPRPAS